MSTCSTNTCKLIKRAKLNNIDDGIEEDQVIVNVDETLTITLEELIKELYEEFKTNNVNVDRIQALMASYDSNPEDWKKYAKFDRDRYTRNLVDEGNGKFNLIVLCWNPAQGSAIHDHSDSHCVMKILQGQLIETLYTWPRENPKYPGKVAVDELESNVLQTNDVCYINDSIGLHRMENPSKTEPAVSLHLYSPPYSSCNAFDRQTGNRTPCKVTFWSKYGMKN
ncbi:hypothetical protein G9C98_008486 [Cotesia typhae]|uniref:Cysteine dioxygenase n=1 Tax=Cotesia typhae TaxID=2053667 RepID=A0A8J5USL8_9HYME|nr:hypothetical protein G9C98_008486 [Cotesia typhae]